MTRGFGCLVAVLLAGCSGSGGNGGAKWTQTAVLPGGAGTGSISILVDGANVLVGTDHGLALSSDDGATWKDSSMGLPPAAGTGVTYSPVEALVSLSGVLLAGTDNGTSSSSDHAATWKNANTGLPDDVSPYAFFVTGTTVLVGTNTGSTRPGMQGGIFRTTDLGGTWTPSSSGWPQGNGCVSFATLVNTLFSCFGAYVGHSTDNGQSWMTSGSGGGSNCLWLETMNGTLYEATAAAGVWKSTDGVTWSNASSGLPSPEIISTVFANGGKLYAGTDKSGVFVSSDGGASWKAMNDGLPTPLPRTVQFAVHGTTLFAVTELGGVWKHPL